MKQRRKPAGNAKTSDRARGAGKNARSLSENDGRDHEPRIATAEPARAHAPSEPGGHIYGVLPVLEALRADSRRVQNIIVAEGVHEFRLHEIFKLAREAGVPVRRLPRVELHRIAHDANHQGVIASVAAARYLTSDELLERLSSRVANNPPLAVVVDGIEDPRNLGAVIRTAECAGVNGVFIPERRAAGLTETVAKTAAGALEYIPLARTGNVARLLEELKGLGVWTVGTAVDADMVYTDWDWTVPCALVLGGEGAGLRRLVRERCDVLVRIPLLGKIESLNVSVAAGILLFEAVRQRTAALARAYKQTPDVNDSQSD